MKYCKHCISSYLSVYVSWTKISISFPGDFAFIVHLKESYLYVFLLNLITQQVDFITTRCTPRTPVHSTDLQSGGIWCLCRKWYHVKLIDRLFAVCVEPKDDCRTSHRHCASYVTQTTATFWILTVTYTVISPKWTLMLRLRKVICYSNEASSLRGALSLF